MQRLGYDIMDPITTEPAASVSGGRFDMVVVGSGFGSAFFLAGILARAPESTRILVLERGGLHDHAWQIENATNSATHHESTYSRASEKPWNFTIGFGGGMNCWFAQTPRMHPNDFRLRSLYGVGEDWPIGYDDLEPHYQAAEEIMSISGDADMGRVLPRSAPFPQPPHRGSAIDRLMKAAQPDHHFIMPTARARIATPTRPACCASLRCQICPADAKFTAQNGLAHVFGDPRVTLVCEARVTRLETSGGLVSAVVFEAQGREHPASADLVVLGANAIHAPAILEASGMGGGLTGRGLHETHGVEYEVLLDGLDNFDGSTITTGLNYALADGDFRSRHGAALVFFENRWKHGLRREPGRWRQTLPLMVVTEDLPSDESRVLLDDDGEPHVVFPGFSDYTRAGMAAVEERLPEILAPLPVEAVRYVFERPTESHLQGTLRMGHDPENSVIDADMVHHRWRNLVCVGSAAFTTCATANPSLTVAALSLRAAERLHGGLR